MYKIYKQSILFSIVISLVSMVLISCYEKEEKEKTVTFTIYTEVGAVTKNSASCIVKLVLEPGNNIKDTFMLGIMWDNRGYPSFSYSDCSVRDYGNDQQYTCQITGLESDTTYYVQGYAYYDGKYYYSTVITFTTLKETGLTIGMSYQGGIIAYLDATGEHGLIASPYDQSEGIQWYNGDYIETGSAETIIGTGKSNTKKIVQAQGDGEYAAKLCDDLVLNGYNDWFLPSQDELDELRHLVGIFNNTLYWSSSESEISYNAYYNAKAMRFYNSGSVGRESHDKNRTYRVRAVRNF